MPNEAPETKKKCVYSPHYPSRVHSHLLTPSSSRSARAEHRRVDSCWSLCNRTPRPRWQGGRLQWIITTSEQRLPKKCQEKAVRHTAEDLPGTWVVRESFETGNQEAARTRRSVRRCAAAQRTKWREEGKTHWQSFCPLLPRSWSVRMPSSPKVLASSFALMPIDIW